MDTFVNGLAILGLTGIAGMTIAYPLAVVIPAGILALAWARPGDLPVVCGMGGKAAEASRDDVRKAA